MVHNNSTQWLQEEPRSPHTIQISMLLSCCCQMQMNCYLPHLVQQVHLAGQPQHCRQAGAAAAGWLALQQVLAKVGVQLAAQQHKKQRHNNVSDLSTHTGDVQRAGAAAGPRQGQGAACCGVGGSNTACEAYEARERQLNSANHTRNVHQQHHKHMHRTHLSSGWLQMLHSTTTRCLPYTNTGADASLTTAEWV